MQGHDVTPLIERWRDAGLIDAGQADSILAFEADRPTAPSTPRWIEPVSYLGAALVIVALMLFGFEVWGRIPGWGRIGISYGATIVLLVVGAVLTAATQPPARRGGQLAWFLAVPAAAASTALLFNEYGGISSRWEALAVALVAAILAGVLWATERTTLQQVALAGSLVATVYALSDPLPLLSGWLVIVCVVGVGVIWLLLSWGGLMEPVTTGWTLGALLVALVGFGGDDWWPITGVIVALALVWLSTRIELRSVLVVGVLALLVWIPTAVTDLFSGTVAVPIAILVTGVVTLGVVIAAVRATPKDAPADVPAVATDEQTPDA